MTPPHNILSFDWLIPFQKSYKKAEKNIYLSSIWVETHPHPHRQVKRYQGRYLGFCVQNQPRVQRRNLWKIVVLQPASRTQASLNLQDSQDS